MSARAAELADVALAPTRLSLLGVDAGSGRLSIPQLDVEAIAACAVGLGARVEAAAGAPRGVLPTVDTDDLASAGWGIVFNRNAPKAVREALAPLIAHRQRQAAGRVEKRFRELANEHGYRSGDRAHRFLMRQGAGFGPVDPDQLPYYLLLIGGPEEIPFEVEHQLAIQYAVGRVAFDSVEEYAAYAESVVEAEIGPVPVRERSVCVFGATHDGDVATEVLNRRLLMPLVSHLKGIADGWRLETCFAAEATKACLADHLGTQTPGLLITGSHGLEVAAEDPAQRQLHGALVCREWSSGGCVGPLPAECYFAASDVDDEADVLGLVALHVACYSGGMPAWDRFAHRQADDPRGAVSPQHLSSEPFVARLPQQLLAHPRGGAAAVIGHVDRAWGYGWVWTDQGRQMQTFEGVVSEILAGQRVGHALRFFGERYGELAALVSSMVEETQYGDGPAPVELARMWTALNDARGWVLLGDPAVRAAAGAAT